MTNIKLKKTNLNADAMQNILRDIEIWALELGFAQIGVSDTDLSAHENHLLNWLDKGLHGEMEYMSRHGVKRSRPEKLVPGTLRVISVRMNYLPPKARDSFEVLAESNTAFISRYALGRDYHKVMRKRLQKLAERIESKIGSFGYRAFVDSAPVLEKGLAEKAGLGWIGKHTNLLSEQAGSWFFLGELFTDLPLPISNVKENHCGSCSACIEACPTRAIIGPYKLDARKCISYLTIEKKGAIPIEFRKAMGNRIYGCDDCQLVCPWNKFAKITSLNDFEVRNDLDSIQLVELFRWSEQEFLHKTEGSAIRRIGYERWLRNVAVALGNVGKDDAGQIVMDALHEKIGHSSALVREHVEWAIEQQFGNH